MNETTSPVIKEDIDDELKLKEEAIRRLLQE